MKHIIIWPVAFVLVVLCMCGTSDEGKKDELRFFRMDEWDLMKSDATLDSRNAMLYTEFERAKLNDEKKAGPLYTRAMNVKQASMNLCRYIDNLKSDLKMMSEGGSNRHSFDTLSSWLLTHPDDIEVPTHYFTGSDPAKCVGKAVDLRMKLRSFRSVLLSNLGDSTSSSAMYTVRLFDDLKCDEVYSHEQNRMMSWEASQFYQAPMVAALARLSAIAGMVKTAEGYEINELLKRTF